MLATDNEQFDCTACELAIAQAALWPENAEAWRVFLSVARRFIADTHLTPVVLAQHLAGRDEEHALDLIDRLALIYDMVVPSPKGES